ncbi:MAG: ATP-dependent DNA ligase [Candidatus Diapherotrites archaeon]|nr:ATP-dependent DNA ligase [Candidatus Diapherotrites archaeon]
MQFKIVADYFEKIEKANSRLLMTDLLAELFKKTGSDDIQQIVFLCQGQLAPPYEGLDIGMGEKFVEEAIAKISGYPKKEIEQKFKVKGDLGLVAEEVLKKKKQSALFSGELSVAKVFNNLLKIARAEGKGSQDLKIRLLAELLNSAKPVEAKYIIRVPLGHLRLGIGDPTIMDAFAINLLKEADAKLKKEIEDKLKEKKVDKRKEEFERKLRMRIRELIEEKYNVHSDLGSIAEKLKRNGLNGLKEIHITPGVPIRPTLAERLPSAGEIVKKLGKCAVEAKYDGFRVQVHKYGEKVTIFSRRQENMTPMFPEIAEAVKKQVKAKDAIFEGEALAVNEQTGEYLPFQVTIQRKRKYDIKEMAKDFPLRLFVFDVMFDDGKNLMGLPFKERRKKLEKLIKKGNDIELTKSIVTDSPKTVDKFFEENVGKGLEGIIAKDLSAPYIAGARKFSWIKLKRSYKGELQDSVDVAIIGYFKGKGARTQFGLGALLTAVYDEKEDMLRSIAKVGTGMSEQQLQDLEKILSKTSVKKKPARVDSELEADVWVSPKYVIEVRADEITKSPVHRAGKKEEGEGLALRFPRMISIRQDKKPEEATSVKEIIKMFKQQTHVKIGEEK